MSQNINQSETGIGANKLSVKLYVSSYKKLNIKKYYLIINLLQHKINTNWYDNTSYQSKHIKIPLKKLKLKLRRKSFIRKKLKIQEIKLKI